MHVLFYKPKPKYKVIGRLEDGLRDQKRYLLILDRRWGRPPGRPENHGKQWLYDGILAEQNGYEPLQLVNLMHNVPEDRLRAVTQVKFIPGFAPA